MLDFLKICQRYGKGKKVEIYPAFIYCKSKDLMIRGGDFYAVWNEKAGLWSTDEDTAISLIDAELRDFYEERKESFDDQPSVLYLRNTDSGMIDKWHKYVQKQMRDNFTALDETLIFSNHKTVKEDYASRRLSYPLEKGDISSYDEMMSVLYSSEERRKLEWAIGAVVSGDSVKIQKFLVLYGAPSTGKSTVLHIIEDLFEGYCVPFDAKAIGSSTAQFALEAFKTNPLVAIQHDGDLSRIEDNTRLNSIVSHEAMTIDAKYSKLYSMAIRTFLFLGTNKPVKITDAKSGLLRRLIDVSPTGNKLPRAKYDRLKAKIKFELGAIAYHCLEVYKSDPGYYDSYVPTNMLGASNDFYNFILDSFDSFTKDEITLKSAWVIYKDYCEEARVAYPYSMMKFKEELKNYFDDFQERYYMPDGTRARNVYLGFKKDKFEYKPRQEETENTIIFENIESEFDKMYMSAKAQYAGDDEAPILKWDEVETVLSDLDTRKLHYVRVPKNHIVLDFDLKDETGAKNFELNLKAASRFPRTYAELSKSGAGIHLHYIYDGDVDRLARLYDKDIEIKVFRGKSSLRRKLTKCSADKIATINSGLPLKEENTKMINFDAVKSERSLRNLIKRNLNKEIFPNTKPSIDFIVKILDDAYKSDLKYDVTDMRPAVLTFAAKSTNKADYCIKQVSKMKFKSDEPSEAAKAEDDELIFFDVEVFPNLFVVVWKKKGSVPVKMINPSPAAIEDLLRHNLVGFNCRRYDNHILYARLKGYSNEELFKLSQRIISGSKNAMFGEAYNISYTDVYDFSSKKQSLKKFEIELGIHHQELGIPWDKPVEESLWETVADYCVNDVVATEATFESRSADFKARQILADVAGLTPNDTTNTLTTSIIFGKDKNPQSKFVYTDLSTMFPGYKFERGVSTYRGEVTGEGGYVYSEPGMYSNVALLDIASMHPTSIEQLNLFGPYTKNFSEIKKARILIKHKQYDEAAKMFGGKLKPYLENDEDASALAYALKIAINSVYGLTSASFDNKCRDPRNVDNIVAKRGALFMIDLKHAVQEKGFTVAHIKTDSIKIPDATQEIIDFVMDFGKQYGYIFEHEATYDRMCLVNDAVYVAKYKDEPHWDESYQKKLWWTATGTQFQVPYVFKSLFIKEPIIFSDLCETKTVTTSLYLDMNESLPQLTSEEKTKLDYIDKAWHSDNSDAITEVCHKLKISAEDLGVLYSDLCKKEEASHSYHFVGKAGLFCPIKKGCGGGLLMREKDGSYSAATGTKGYRWLEAEMVKTLGKEGDIDRSYYERLTEEAIISISEYGDFEWFVS